MANARFLGSPAQISTTPAPSSSTLHFSRCTCPGCGQDVDPLRAGHVAILDGRFCYFCQSDCKQAYLQARGQPPQEDIVTASPPEVSFENGASLAQVASDAAPKPQTRIARAVLKEPPATEEACGQETAVADLGDEWPASTATPSVRHPKAAQTERRSDRLAALDSLGMVVGGLVPAIGLLGPAVDAARVPLVVLSWAALMLRVLMLGRDPADPHRLVVLAPCTGAVVAACWAAAIHDPRAPAVAVFAALSCAAAIAIESLIGRVRRRVGTSRARIERALDVSVRVVQGGALIHMPASEVRAGESIVVEAGEIVGADAIVTAGEARIVPWLGARIEVVRREGEPILAGARVLSNGLRMTTTWSGRDRAWVKLLSSHATRIDVASPTARLLRLTVERGAPLAAVVVGVAALAANASPVEVVAAMCAGAIAFGSKAASSSAAFHFARAHLEALANGVVYRDARAFERAAAANLAVLSARGTVLMGEPEIVAIEPVGAIDAERVLSLAAGAEMGFAHPFAAAVMRAARMRGVRPDDVRNATSHDGLGVTALASTGERLVVGGRAIMLEEKIGVATTDAHISELEAQGRSVLLVALCDRLVGVIALQDGLRQGARAAVQRLLDARIEPVLLSGEARDTCDTIGRALDIEHVRPEVLPAQRGLEVRALAEGGNIVAVIGHPAGDDGALGAADVAVAMGTAGATSGEWAVVLASDDVRDAALALAIPHAARDRARVAMALGATPGLIALLAIGFGVAPLAVAPIAALIGALAVAAHARE
ncbi:MAG: HAD family hydrolase [Myxococcota bacterium]|nr:HAD family hydrolase [Myxococcota bacterium]